MLIQPDSRFQSTQRQGGLHHLGGHEIEQALGFPPNMPAHDKSDYEWQFRVDGVLCAIWDYKGSADMDMWSFFGPRAVMVRLFGEGCVS